MSTLTAVKIDTTPWVEKYRPKTLDEIVLPQRIKDKFTTGEVKGLYNNFIFKGTAGLGKTTLARILAKGRSFKVINASSDSGIDMIRDEIANYCSTASLKGDGKKVLLLDEADSLTGKAQDAARGTIEKFVNNAFFIMTMNYPEKLTAPIFSRFEVIDFNFTDAEDQEQLKGYYIRLVYIAKQEGLTLHKDGLIELVRQSYPDFRAIINNLQGIARTTKEITFDAVKQSSTAFQDAELYNFLLSEFEAPKIYAYTKSRFMNKEHAAYGLLGAPFFEWLNNNGKSDKVGIVAKIAHKYSYESQKVVDKLISLTACMFELSQIFK